MNEVKSDRVFLFLRMVSPTDMDVTVAIGGVNRTSLIQICSTDLFRGKNNRYDYFFTASVTLTNQVFKSTNDIYLIFNLIKIAIIIPNHSPSLITCQLTDDIIHHGSWESGNRMIYFNHVLLPPSSFTCKSFNHARMCKPVSIENLLPLAPH